MGLLRVDKIFPCAKSRTMQEAKIFVTPDKSAKAIAAERGGVYAKNLTKGFKEAATLVNAGGPVSVSVLVASGEYDGDLGSGAYELPLFNNPEAHLTIQGGYDSAFEKRDAFGTPTQIVTINDRSAPMIKFPKRCMLASFIFDGIIMDTANSNSYDAQTNSLLSGRSCSHRFIHFEYLETDKLEFMNSAFLNASHRVMEPLIRAASDQATIAYRNCIFLNNIIPLKLDSARFRHKPAEIVVDHCSFLINWAHNPDVNTSNPAALEIGPSDAAEQVSITNNLFFANFGGAILALHLKLPKLVVNSNNFFGNGLLHGQTDPAAVAMIVAAGGRKQPLEMDDIEDVDSVEEAEDNVSMDPGLSVATGDVGTVDADKVQVQDTWENSVRGLFGMNLDGGKVEIRNFAPKQTWDTSKLPFPSNLDAQVYGAQSTSD